MAFGVLPGSARSVFMAAVPGLFKRGLSANAMISYAKKNLLPYRRINMLADIRRVTGLAKLEKLVRAVAPDRLFPAYTMVQSDFRAARRYFVKAKMDLIDDETGEVFEKWVSFYDNTRSTKSQWSNDFMSGYVAGRYGEGVTIKTMEIVSVEHKKGWAY